MVVVVRCKGRGVGGGQSSGLKGRCAHTGKGGKGLGGVC